MKAYPTGAGLALALILAGCGDGADNGTTTATGTGNTAAPLQQVEAPNGDWTQAVTETADGGFLMGNPNAPVKLVEYASLTCPACATFSNQAAEELMNEYVRSGQVSWEFRNFVLNPIDLGVSMLVRCQGAAPFFRSVEQLYADQPVWLDRFQNIPEAEINRINALPREQAVAALIEAGDSDQFFRQRGMPESRIDSCLADQQAVNRLVEISQVATQQHEVQGTPTFLINGEKVDASQWPELEPLLREAIG